MDELAKVLPSDADAVLNQLRELYERSVANKQDLFAFVFGTAVDSLEDNLATAADIEAESDAA